MNEDKTELAEDRTRYAADRTALANERTSSAWMRTGIAALVAGFGALRFLGDTLPAWAVRPIATICLLCAIAAFSFAAWRYHRLGRQLSEANVRTLPFALILVISLSLIVATCIGLFSVWWI